MSTLDIWMMGLFKTVTSFLNLFWWVHIFSVLAMLGVVVMTFVENPITILFVYLSTVIGVSGVIWSLGWQFLSIIVMMVVVGSLVVYFLTTLVTYFSSEIGQKRYSLKSVGFSEMVLSSFIFTIGWSGMSGSFSGWGEWSYWSHRDKAGMLSSVLLTEVALENVLAVHGWLSVLVLMGLLLTMMSVSYSSVNIKSMRGRKIWVLDKVEKC